MQKKEISSHCPCKRKEFFIQALSGELGGCCSKSNYMCAPTVYEEQTVARGRRNRIEMGEEQRVGATLAIQKSPAPWESDRDSRAVDAANAMSGYA